MKRLNIWLVGRCDLLRALNQELLGFGHACYLQGEQASLPLSGVDLLIEDGSLPLDPALRRDVGAAPQWLLQATLHGGAGLELPETALWVLRDGQACLHAHVEGQHNGSGRALHHAAIQQWTEVLCDAVGSLARGDDALPGTATATVLRSCMPMSRFDNLAYLHTGNRTENQALLVLAEQPLGAQLEASFAHYADKSALRWNASVWTYAQLREAAEPIRQRVLALGTQPDRPVVGVCLEKGPELFACVLGIVLSGAIYLPLEPSHPMERRHFILENSGAHLLFQNTDGAVLKGAWEVVNPALLGASVPWPAGPQWSPDAPCMALYTSGTTGQPKGVLLSQRNLSHFTNWYAAHTALEEGTPVLQFSTLSFDSATIDLFPTWLSGATLVVANEDQRRDPAQLAALIATEGIVQGFLPPALLSIMPIGQLAGMRCITTGGDVCEPRVIERLAGQCRFINLYGPTEATVLVTARDFTPGTANRSLGWPIANSQVWVLDDEGLPALPRETGELYLIGPGVGLGYINNPEQTRQRYVQLALPDGSSVRAYRTGDLGRWGPDGLELVGRKDNQIKIRGFRVEPEEIECCLRESELFGQVAVAVAEGRRILAFVAQPIQGAASCVEALRDYLGQRLPGYMHPSLCVELPTLPMAPNGKVDRQALLSLPLSTTEISYKAPATPRQRDLQLIWAELLELAPEEISTDESFFNLGGHSIVLSAMLLKLRERFGRGISINRFIEVPTLERLDYLLGAGDISGDNQIDPKALRDAAQELGIKPLQHEQMGDVHKVLVTGANSFVGVHIVAALLQWGASEVTCLVRPSQGETAMARFSAALVDNQLTVDMNRVRVIAADFSEPRLGMTADEYERIDCAYGAVIHNGAHVNHVLDYPALAPSNIEPLFQLLALCEGKRKKILSYVSTLSACSAVDSTGAVLEDGPVDTPPIYIRNGYNLSKWVGERILSRARKAGSYINIFRPGNVSFSSVTGVCQPHKNRLMLMLKGSLQLAAVPALDLNFDLMPVDFLARLIAFQSSRHAPDAAVFNLHNPEPLSWPDYIASFAALGYDFDLVPVATWQERLKDVDQHNALFGVLGFYLNGFEEDIGDISRIHYRNAAQVIQRMGEAYPIKEPALLARGSAYLQSIGFI